MFKEKAKVYSGVYIAVAFAAYRVIKEHLLNSWLDNFGEHRLLLKVSLALVFSVFVAVTCSVILGDSRRYSRRTIMNNVGKWLFFVAYLAAFVLLMAGVYAKATGPQGAIIAIIACSVIYVPNLWAFMRLLSDKKE